MAGVLLLAACGDDTAAPENPPRRDVTMTSCAADTIGISAKGELVNHSSKRSTYTIEVNFYDQAGTQVGSGFDFVNNVAPDGRATWEATGFNDQAERCEIIEVTRSAS